MQYRLDERLVFAPARAGDGASGLVEGLADGLAALCRINDDEGFAQHFGVVLRSANHDRRFAVQHAVAAAGVAGGDACDFERNDGRVKQSDDPADGAHKALGLAGAPVHVFGPIEGEDFLGQIGGQRLLGGNAETLDGCADVLALCCGDFLKRSDGNAGLPGEGFGCSSGRTVFECHLPRRAGHLLFGIGLAREYALNQQGEAARRGEGGEPGAVGEQTLAGEQFEDAAAEFGLCPGNHAGGNFFQPDLQ